MSIVFERRAHPLGTHRVLEPNGAMPQSAWKLDNTPVALENEILCDVETLNIDSASFKQISDECGGDARQDLGAHRWDHSRARQAAQPRHRQRRDVHRPRAQDRRSAAFEDRLEGRRPHRVARVVDAYAAARRSGRRASTSPPAAYGFAARRSSSKAAYGPSFRTTSTKTSRWPCSTSPAHRRR